MQDAIFRACGAARGIDRRPFREDSRGACASFRGLDNLCGPTGDPEATTATSVSSVGNMAEEITVSSRQNDLLSALQFAVDHLQSMRKADSRLHVIFPSIYSLLCELIGDGLLSMAMMLFFEKNTRIVRGRCNKAILATRPPAS